MYFLIYFNYEIIIENKILQIKFFTKLINEKFSIKFNLFFIRLIKLFYLYFLKVF